MSKMIRIIANWVLEFKPLERPMKTMFSIFEYMVISKGGEILFYPDPERIEIVRLINSIRREKSLLMSNTEAIQVYSGAKSTAKIDGIMAEVGAYQGASAKLICLACDKPMYVFDTFEGLPEPTKYDHPRFSKGDYNATFENVQEYLKGYPKVQVIKGFFPDSSDPIIDKKFSFVNLDVDLYQSTKDSLEFFYPRMSRGGVIISHNYHDSPGIRKVFADFFADKPEPIIEIGGSQCLVVKL